MGVDYEVDNYSHDLDQVDDWKDDLYDARVQHCYWNEEDRSYSDGCCDGLTFDHVQHGYQEDIDCEVDGLHGVHDGVNVDYDCCDGLCYDDDFVLDGDYVLHEEN